METIIKTFINEIACINDQYKNTNCIEELKTNINTFCKKYKEYSGIGDYILNVGEMYMTNGDYSAGIVFIRAVDKYFMHVNNKTLLYLRMAEYHIEYGETEEGIKYLMLLCTETVDNYEESIEINELTDVWQKYKHLVENKVPASVAFNTARSPLPPEKCSMQIGEIFSLSEENILDELSVHLGELSANGDAINYLNKWEKVVFYADELCMEVNSGGFEGYLYYYGHHFEKAYQSFEIIGASHMASIMDGIRFKFPKKKIPKALNSIQNVMDSMEESGVDFEEEDSKFYESGVNLLMSSLLDYIIANRNHFR